MAEVYWIRRPEHTDILTQGYVGVTSKTALERFKVHKDTASAKRSKKSVVHKAIKAIGADNLVCETILIAEEAYCYEMENRLRPTLSIGWNVAIGGTKPPGVKGLPVSEETRAKLSKALKGKPVSEGARKALALANVDREFTEEHRRKLSEAGKRRKATPKMIALLIERNISKTGEKRSEDSRNKQSETLKNKGYWNTPRANLDVWKDADYYYDLFLQGLSAYLVSKNLGVSRHCLVAIFKHFKNGWKPLNDDLWLEQFKSEILNDR